MIGVSSRHARRRAGGFTLIELLVVMAILAILAALILPAMQRAKASAMLVSCKSNARQISIGLTMYVGDFAAYPYTFSQAFTRWPDVLTNHVATAGYRGVWKCPSRFGDRQVWSGGVWEASRLYGYNERGYLPEGRGQRGLGGKIDEFATAFRTSPIRESEVRVPSNMIAVGDNARNASASTIIDGGLGIERNTFAMGFLPPEMKKYAMRAADQRHNRRANVGFCDGHVETVKFQPLFLDYSDAALRRWNVDHEPHRTP